MRASLPRRLALLLFLLLGIAATGANARAEDMFGRPTGPAPVSPAARIELPAPLRPVLALVVEWQSRLNAVVRGQLQRERAGETVRPLLVILAASFLYGVVHAVGPGHGKLVVGSYFLTRRARVLQGIAMSATAALVQALAAIVLVAVLAALFATSSAAIFSRAGELEMTSYAAIVAVGLWMLLGALRGAHRHDLAIASDGISSRNEWTRLLAAAAAVGLRPCSGAILVLLFCLANGMLAIGVLAAFAIALGVAITVSLVSLTSLGIHRSLAGSKRAERIGLLGYRAVALGGALLITLFGLIELVGVWSGALAPGAG